MNREEPAFQIQFANLPLLVLHLHTTDMEKLKSQIESRLAQTPDYFADTTMALGLSGIADAGFTPDFADLTAFMSARGMRTAGVVGGSPAQREAAVLAGLGLFPETSPRPARQAVAPPEPVIAAEVPIQPELPGFEVVTPEPEAAADSSAAPDDAAEADTPWAAGPQRPTLVITKPVRTGQRIYAEGANLVVLAIVNAGAELIADGDIHVYAPLRGKAIAGARGNEGARIFVQRMEAELISIAGCFRVFEDGVPENVRGKAAQVHLEGSRLVFETLPE